MINGNYSAINAAQNCPKQQVIERQKQRIQIPLFQKVPHEPTFTPYELTQKVNIKSSDRSTGGGQI